MKKIFAFVLVLCSISFAAIGAVAGPSDSPSLAAEAKTHQILGQILGGRRHHRRNRNNNNESVRYETRIVHKGRKSFRDTYRITTNLRTGKEKVKRVSRVRIS